ncbi:hypothetical protein DFH27DRAFT_521702 [Peziza echinospora]|nr:hypothetical protein DFH27DRAFT_521702 [Peziza echinospora]
MHMCLCSLVPCLCGSRTVQYILSTTAVTSRGIAMVPTGQGNRELELTWRPGDRYRYRRWPHISLGTITDITDPDPKCGERNETFLQAHMSVLDSPVPVHYGKSEKAQYKISIKNIQEFVIYVFTELREKVWGLHRYIR